MDKPPCLSTLGENPCLRRHYEWAVYGSGPLHGAWEGWRVAGDCLVSPEGYRIRVGRVRAVAALDGMGVKRRSKIENVLPFRQIRKAATGDGLVPRDANRRRLTLDETPGGAPSA